MLNDFNAEQPAFPTPSFTFPDPVSGATLVCGGCLGITKREYFAGLAMQALVGSIGDVRGVENLAVEMADRLILQLGKS